jgi:hypothetical protein
MLTTRARLRYLLDGLLIGLLALLLIAPLFQLEVLNHWGSIESTFISDARWLSEHLPRPEWQPLWYGGTRFDYIYPPALRYGTALLAAALDVHTARAYHLYTGAMYVGGIIGVYFFAVLLTGSRRMGWAAAVLCALVSPSYLFLPEMRNDAPHLLPQRLRVLMMYGEGPHMSAFAMLPWTQAAGYRAMLTGSAPWIGFSALCAALVVSNNFYGATALAMMFPVMWWAAWVTGAPAAPNAPAVHNKDARTLLRAAVIAALAYALTAVWLTPDYLMITARNLQLVARPSNAWSLAAAPFIVLLFAVLSYRWARGRPDRAWGVIAAGLVYFTTVYVWGASVGFSVAGEPFRLTPEWDFALILGGLTVLRYGWHHALGMWPARVRSPLVWQRALVVLLLVLALVPARRYLRHAWSFFPEDAQWQTRPEYRLTRWQHENRPHDRSFVMGSIRFWYNAWFNLAQINGGSEQGMLNMKTIPMGWEVRLGPEPEPGVLWMQCFGVGSIIMSDERSRDVYHDYVHPRKFDGYLHVLHDDGEGNTIYEIPRRFPSFGRVVRREQVESLETPAHNVDVERLRAYVAAIEQGPDAEVTVTQERPERFRLRARVGSGEMVLYQMSYDPAWHAYLSESGEQAPVREDVLGQMLIDTPPGEHDVLLVFETPWQNRVGGVLSTAGLVTVAMLLASGVLPRRRRAAVVVVESE